MKFRTPKGQKKLEQDAKRIKPVKFTSQHQQDAAKHIGGILTEHIHVNTKEFQNIVAGKSKAKVYRESKLQIECVKWFDAEHMNRYTWRMPDVKKNTTRRVSLLMKIANDGYRPGAMGGIVSAEGISVGAADLFFACPGFMYRGGSDALGLFIEMKTDTGKQKPEQVMFESITTDKRFRYEVVRSFDEFRNLINDYLA